MDFGAEKSFGQAVKRVREHYGIEVPTSAVRHQTETHGARMLERQETERLSELGPKPGVELLITEMDGSLVPLVETGINAAGERLKDQRGGRRLYWQEARLCLAREPEKITPRYGACLGEVEDAGAVWLDCVVRAGAGTRTHLHGLGDGALWIAGQVKERFGEQATYLCDFYHVSEYLAAAARPGPQARPWLRQQQHLLKENRLAEVLAELAPRVEPPTVAEVDAPVRACFRYLDNRKDQVNYRSAIEAGLPIGSGEIESSHRSVIQERLKISGAWWLRENAQRMLALRVARANEEWETYWRQLGQAAA